MNKFIEAFKGITELSIDKDGRLYIADMKQYLSNCELVEQACKFADEHQKPTCKGCPHLVEGPYLNCYEIKCCGMSDRGRVISYTFNDKSKITDKDYEMPYWCPIRKGTFKNFKKNQ